MSKEHKEKTVVLKPKKREHDPTTEAHRNDKRKRKAESNAKLPSSYRNRLRRNKVRLTADQESDLTDLVGGEQS